MLMATSRPMYLKKRILSDKGHLDNTYSAIVMTKVLGENTREIVLAHLSEEANTHELAYNTYMNIFKSNKIRCAKPFVKTNATIWFIFILSKTSI